MFDIRNIPPVVKNIIIVNGLFFLATVLLANQGLDLSSYFGLHYWKSESFYPHQLVSYMFMHGGFTHILFNMFAVWMFGRVLEGVWGQKRFLIFYVVTGLGAGIIQLLVAHVRLMPILAELPYNEVNTIISEGRELLESGKNWVGIGGEANLLINTPTVGASGAVFGILLAFGMLFPNTELMLLFPPIPIKAKWFVIGYGLLELYAGFSNNPNDNVAHFAHLGGMLFGFILIKYWQKDRGTFY